MPTPATPTPTPTPTEAPQGPHWGEEWLPLSAIVKAEGLQVRKRLDKAALHRYAEMTKAGRLPPPIKVAQVQGPTGPVFLLVDGWHRMAAGALQTSGNDVRALVAEMTEKEAGWVAAEANMGHGVPLKPGEYREVFRAFIKAGKHRKARGEVMSYREIGAHILKPQTTIRNWMQRDFKALFRRMAAGEKAGQWGGHRDRPTQSPTEEQAAAALEAIKALPALMAALSATQRHELAEALRAGAAHAEALGTEAPEF